MSTAPSETSDAKEAPASSRRSELLIQAIAGFFVTVMAPVLVALGMKLPDFLTAPKPDADKQAVATTETAPASPAKASGDPATKTPADPAKVPDAPTGSCASLPDRQSSEPRTKPRAETPVQLPVISKPNTQAIRLFNGSDLAGFYSFYAPSEQHSEAFGAKDRTLHIVGYPIGMLVTEQEYSNYYLEIEFRWEGKIWPPHEGKARRSGLLLHCQAPDGSIEGRWMPCVALPNQRRSHWRSGFTQRRQAAQHHLDGCRGDNRIEGQNALLL